jgi:hypothetical protein
MAARGRRFILPTGQVLAGVEMSTWLVHPDHRSGGAGVKVLNILRERADFCVGASITPEARDIYLRLGFRWCPALPRFIYAPDWSRLPGLVRDPLLAQRIARARAVPGLPQIDVQPISLDMLGSVTVMNGAGAFDRSAPTLQWRYARNPFFVYRAARVMVAGATAEVIYREEQFDSTKILRVVDLLGPPEALSRVPQGLAALCSESGAVAVDVFCSHVDVRDAFAAAGWFILPDDECVMDLPHLLAPPSHRSPNSYSLVSWLSPRFRGLLADSALFVTKQDCDMDRLAALPHG